MENQLAEDKVNNPPDPEGKSYYSQLIISIVLLFLILGVGAYLRFSGMNWDANQHLHPDERFLTMVESGLQPVKSLAQYFNTELSTLNPNNVGYGYYVYGTLPIFIVRYLAEFIKQAGYDEVFLVGRYTSACVDLLTILFVFFIVERIYKKPLMAVLAAAFSAFSVLQIEQAHYFTTDTFTNLFTFMAFYFAARVMTDIPKHREVGVDPEDPVPGQESFGKILLGHWSSTAVYVLFGISLGLAMASKVSVYLVPGLLVLAVVVRFFQLAPEDRRTQAVLMARNLIIAAIFSLVLFRIFQPYAFKGPGFFDIGLNPKWVSNLQDLYAQSNGDVDVPFALQWARRPPWFAFENMVVWGLGLPLGILAWSGFLWMGWRIIKGEWKKHLLIWGWTGIIFLTQSQLFNPTMRYLLFVYPSLAMVAAWTVFSLWETKKRAPEEETKKSMRWNTSRKALSVVIGAGVLGATIAWAFAFVQIYITPMTRVAASEWIYQNVPGPIDLKIQSSTGVQTQPLPFRSGITLLGGQDIKIAFTPQQDGVITNITLPHVIDPVTASNPKTLTVQIAQDFAGSNVIGSGSVSDNFNNPGSDQRGNSFTISFNQAPLVSAKQKYYFIFHYDNPGVNLASTITYNLIDPQGESHQSWLPDPVDVVMPGKPFQMTFNGLIEGVVNEIDLPHIVDWDGNTEEKTIQISILDSTNLNVLSSATLKDSFLATQDPRGNAFTLKLDTPFNLKKDGVYLLKIQVLDGNGAIGFYGSRPALESTWDDAIPVGINGFNSFDYSTGIYRSDLNFEMYWDDNKDKLQRFKTILDQADYIYITSNRQYASIPRVPERYPLTSVYYRNLIGCPADKDIIWCYYVATPGQFMGNLGFDLVHIQQSEPTIGPFTFNSQFAEEAFTVYDHPKVLIFKKNSQYSAEKVSSILDNVDLSNVMHVTPRQASNLKGNMMLPADRLTQEQAGGTWSDLFNHLSLLNEIPAVGAVVWYLVIMLLGWICFPLVRLTFSGLPDKGFPLTRLVGLLSLAYLTWVAGSNGIPFSVLTISCVFGLLILINGGLFWLQRKSILEDIRENWKRYLTAELIFLGLFMLFLLVRLGNPDLWHPAKGGEKPMDFSFLNAVIKSTSFPPYDPWFAGGYINYYYFGFVLIGVPIKWLGIIPSIAYNLVLPTFFAFFGTAAFSIGWNLMWAFRFVGVKPDAAEGEETGEKKTNHKPLVAGLMATVLSLLVGNLGMVRMIWQGFMRLSNPNFEAGNMIDQFTWAFQGIGMFFSHAQLPYGAGDWYWIPSRIIPGEPITEFPLFTFLYADPHAHLFALPLTLLALSWALSILLQKWTWEGESRWVQILQGIATFVMGGLVIGCLYPTNTWDMPVYLAIGCMAILYSIATNTFNGFQTGHQMAAVLKRIGLGILSVSVLVGLVFLLYRPFSQWFVSGYNTIDPWTGDHTVVGDYLTHWGVFLFIIVSWLIWETIDWMDKTPLSQLRLLEPYWKILVVLFLGFIAVVVLLQFVGVHVAWITLTMAVWALILIFRPNQPDPKRFVLFLVGSAAILTLAVELVVLKGDIGRMNTVFKFYIQSWTLFAVSSAAALVWVYSAVKRYWHPGWRWIWSICLGLLLGGAFLFTILGGSDKITDRMTSLAPHTLDGMAYMQYAQYSDSGKDMNLKQDYLAIQWMQDHVKGSPVIVEANTPEYRWGTRFTIYTGLPGVVGWNWHERQQRAALNTETVFNRVEEVGNFYNTFNVNEAESFLAKYGVKYIIVGQLEKAVYPNGGLQKFDLYNGKLWDAVYQNEDTVIYQVK